MPKLHSEKNHTSSKQKPTILMYILVGLMMLWLVSLIVNTGKKFETRSRAQTSPVVLSLLPASATMPSNKTVELSVNAHDEKITFVRAEVTFDQTKVQLVSEIGTTSKLRTILKKSTKDQANATGRAVVILGLAVADKANPPTGTFTLATYAFSPKTQSTGTATVSVDASALQVVNWDASEMVTQTRTMTFTLNPIASTRVPTHAPTNLPVIPTRLPTQARPNEPTLDPATSQFVRPPVGFGSSPRVEPTPEIEPLPTPEPIPFIIEGDVSGDQCVNLNDIKQCINVLWPFGRHNCDANNDGAHSISDFFYVITRLGNGCGEN